MVEEPRVIEEIESKYGERIRSIGKDVEYEILEETNDVTPRNVSTVLGSFLRGAERIYVAIKSVVSRPSGKLTVTVVYWVITTGIPNLNFYFPQQYDAAKEWANKTITEVVQAEPEQSSPDFIVYNPEWSTNKSLFEEDKAKFEAGTSLDAYHIQKPIVPSEIIATGIMPSGNYYG